MLGCRRRHADRGVKAVDLVLDYIAADLRDLAVRVETLTLDPHNARQHDPTRDLPIIMESLRRFGQRKPIVARRVGDQSVVVAGNGTLLAARRLGWTHIAVSWFHGSDVEARAYALTDNRTAELSRWDFEQLSAQLTDLHALDADLPAALGWDDANLAPFLAATWQVPDVGVMPGAPDPRDDGLVALTLTRAQRAIVEQVIDRVRAHEGSDLPEGRCLELACADWLTGPYPDEA